MVQQDPERKYESSSVQLAINLNNSWCGLHSLITDYHPVSQGIFGTPRNMASPSKYPTDLGLSINGRDTLSYNTECVPKGILHPARKYGTFTSIWNVNEIGENIDSYIIYKKNALPHEI